VVGRGRLMEVRDGEWGEWWSGEMGWEMWRG